MLRTLGRHLTYANVTASLALFIALGGVSYAAVKLPRNSVGTKQIKRNAVTGAKVRNGSLRAGDFAAGQLPRGENGAPGAAGAQGPTGPQGPKGDTGAAGPAGSIAGTPAGGDLTGTYPNPDIGGGVVGAAEIGLDAVASEELATDAAGIAEIATDAVGAAEILLNAVGVAEIATDAVGAAEIVVDAVGAAEIGPDAVGVSELGPNAVTTDEIAGNTIAAGDIATDGVGAAEIVADAVTNSEIDDGTIREQDVGTLALGLRGNNIGVVSFQRSNVPIPSVAAGACVPVNDDDGAGAPVFATVGDFVIPMRPVGFPDGLSLQPTVSDTDSRAVFEVCNRTAAAIDPADTFDIGVLAIRPT